MSLFPHTVENCKGEKKSEQNSFRSIPKTGAGPYTYLLALFELELFGAAGSPGKPWAGGGEANKGEQGERCELHFGTSERGGGRRRKI